MTNESSIWEWKNTAPIIKGTMEVGFAIAAIGMVGAAICATANGVAFPFPLACLTNPWVIAAIASYIAIYFIVTSISSYQQLCSMKGAQGKDADFSALLNDAIIKSGTISVEKSGDPEKETEGLFLKLSKDNYQALVPNNTAKDALMGLHVLLMKDGKMQTVQVEFNHVEAANDGDNYKVKLTSPNKKELGMDDKTTSLKVAVSNKDLEAFKGDVLAKLTNVVIEGAVKKAIS